MAKDYVDPDRQPTPEQAARLKRFITDNFRGDEVAMELYGILMSSGRRSGKEVALDGHLGLFGSTGWLPRMEYDGLGGIRMGRLYKEAALPHLALLEELGLIAMRRGGQGVEGVTVTKVLPAWDGNLSTVDVAGERCANSDCDAVITPMDKHLVLHATAEWHTPDGAEGRSTYDYDYREPWEDYLPAWGDGTLLLCERCATGNPDATEIARREAEAVANRESWKESSARSRREYESRVAEAEVFEEIIAPIEDAPAEDGE